MHFRENHLKGSYLISLDPVNDQRGFFARYFCKDEFHSHNLNTNWVQVNNSLSVDVATLRGLHFQKNPHSEVKLVRCVQGAIWDVIVDLRKDSLTYGQWIGEELSANNRNMFYVPEGFAHGFITLAQNSEIIYHVSKPYNKEAEQTLIWNDPQINIKWPLQPKIISEKDQRASPLTLIHPF